MKVRVTTPESERYARMRGDELIRLCRAGDKLACRELEIRIMYPEIATTRWYKGSPPTRFPARFIRGKRRIKE